MERITKRIVVGLFTIFLITIMILYIDFQTILENLNKISLIGVFLFIISYSFAFIFRAYKLKLIFRGIDFNPKFLTIYGAIGAGWMINEITPAKIGDLAKMEYIHQKESKLPLSKCVCAVLIERFIDLIILFSIASFSLFYMYLNNISDAPGLNLTFFVGIGGLLLLGILIALIFLFFKTNWFLNLIGKFSVRLKDLIQKFLSKFIEGLKDFRKDKKRIIQVFIFNIPTWLFESLTLVIFFYLAGYEISFLVIILAQLITFFTKTIPITPGGWIISEITGALFISLFYNTIPLNDILAIFILDHIIRIAYVFIYGGISVISINFKFRGIDISELEKEIN